jgi:hypothetical protein
MKTVALLLLPLVAACGVAPCGQTSSLQVGGALTVTPISFGASDTVPALVTVGSEQLVDSNLERRPGAFDALWGSFVEGAALGSSTGVAVTMEGGVPNVSATVARMVLILPTPLRAGTEYSLGRVLEAPVGLHNPDVYSPRYLGQEPLAAAGRAELGFFYGRRDFVPPEPFAVETPQFLATSGSGTVRVLSDSGRQLRLHLDVVLMDARGRTLRLVGDFDALGDVQDNYCD